MNNWDFNEVTQNDLYDFKACKRQDGSIYGVPNKSDCVKGKEVTEKEIEALAAKSNKGDKAASEELKKISAVNKEQKKKEKQEEAKKKAAEKKKKDEAEGKKKGKGKKGGGKGKKGGKGKGGKGGGKTEPAAKKSSADSNRQKQQSKQAAMKRARDTVQRLQKMLRDVRDPEARKQIKKAIGDLLKSVVDASKADMGQNQNPSSIAGQVQGQAKQEAKKEEA